MSDRKVRLLIIFAAFSLIFSGVILYVIFYKQGMGNNKNINYVDFNVNHYIEISPVVFNEYNDVYSSINVSRVNIKNIDVDITKEFTIKQDDMINYIEGYYNEINGTDYGQVSTVYSTIKPQMNGAVLSIFYRLDFTLDENIFVDNIKNYMVTLNVDLATNKVLSNDDLLSKFNYSKEYIAEKLFNEDVLINEDQIVIDKNTNISLTKKDIERKKEMYINEIISEFDNIIYMYIENNSLVLVYDRKELNGVFFDNDFETDVKFRYLR